MKSLDFYCMEPWVCLVLRKLVVATIKSSSDMAKSPPGLNIQEAFEQ